jgi:hypothetical protein
LRDIAIDKKEVGRVILMLRYKLMLRDCNEGVAVKKIGIQIRFIIFRDISDGSKFDDRNI